MIINYDRQLDSWEVMTWVEQGSEADAIRDRAADANAGYPIMLSELDYVNFGEGTEALIKVSDIVNDNGIVMAKAIHPDNHQTYQVELDEDELIWQSNGEPGVDF